MNLKKITLITVLVVLVSLIIFYLLQDKILVEDEEELIVQDYIVDYESILDSCIEMAEKANKEVLECMRTELVRLGKDREVRCIDLKDDLLCEGINLYSDELGVYELCYDPDTPTTADCFGLDTWLE